MRGPSLPHVTDSTGHTYIDLLAKKRHVAFIGGGGGGGGHGNTQLFVKFVLLKTRLLKLRNNFSSKTLY